MFYSYSYLLLKSPIIFFTENNIRFSVVPKVVNLVRGLSKDPAAISELKLSDGTTATYKVRFAVAKLQ